MLVSARNSYNYTPEEFETVVKTFYCHENNSIPQIAKRLNLTKHVVNVYLTTHIKQNYDTNRKNTAFSKIS